MIHCFTKQIESHGIRKKVNHNWAKNKLASSSLRSADEFSTSLLHLTTSSLIQKEKITHPIARTRLTKNVSKLIGKVVDSCWPLHKQVPCILIVVKQ